MVDSFNGEDDSFSDCRQGFDSLIDRLVGDNAKVTGLNRGSTPASSTFIPHAPVAQSADAPDLKSGNSAGSMPAGGTDGSAYWYGQFAWKADVP